MDNLEIVRGASLAVAKVYWGISIAVFLTFWWVVLMAIIVKKDDYNFSLMMARYSRILFVIAGFFLWNAAANYLGINFFEYLTLAGAVLILMPVWHIGEKIINKIYWT